MNKNRENRTYLTKKNINYERLMNRSVCEVTKTEYLKPILQKKEQKL